MELPSLSNSECEYRSAFLNIVHAGNPGMKKPETACDTLRKMNRLVMTTRHCFLECGATMKKVSPFPWYACRRNVTD